MNPKFGAPIEDEDLGWRATRIKIALETSHTFEQIDNMSFQDIMDLKAWWGAEAKVAESSKKKK